MVFLIMELYQLARYIPPASSPNMNCTESEGPTRKIAQGHNSQNAVSQNGR